MVSFVAPTNVPRESSYTDFPDVLAVTDPVGCNRSHCDDRNGATAEQQLTAKRGARRCRDESDDAATGVRALHRFGEETADQGGGYRAG